jgi:hypothetical protein
VVHGHARPRFGQRERDGAADPTACPGNQRDTSAQGITQNPTSIVNFHPIREFGPFTTKSGLLPK